MIHKVDITELLNVPPEHINEVIEQAKYLYNVKQDSQRGHEIAMMAPYVTYDDGRVE